MVGEISQNDFLQGIVPAEVDAHQFLDFYAVLDVHIQQILFSVGGLRQIVVVVHPERLCTAECDVPAVALTVQGKGLTVQAALAKLGVGIQVEDAWKMQ